MNNIRFWDKYLNETRQKLKNLVNSQNKIRVDLHIHSNYSTDATYKLSEIIEYSRNKFDVISITDHDTLDAYDELYEMICLNKIPENLIIIPGVEMTIDDKKYGGQCHILQYMINPKAKDIKKMINDAKKATYKRAKIQFKRIENNMALKYYMKNSGISFDYEEYCDYLKTQPIAIPEYANIISYIDSKLEEKGITVLNIFDKLEEYSVLDDNKERMQLRQNRYIQLREKYKNTNNLERNKRLLLSILAVKEDDDDYYPNSKKVGSLSVNSYGQYKVSDLNFKNITVFAHPSEKSVDRVIELLNKYDFRAVEKNVRSTYYNKKSEAAIFNNRVVTKGSDSHDNKEKFYSDLKFFEVSSNILKVFYEQN